KRGIMGWRFGGAWALKHDMVTQDLDAAAMFYGRMVFVLVPLRAVNAPLLRIFAILDEWLTPVIVYQFAYALFAAAVDNTLIRYDADHAFANPSGGNYNEEAAADAWQHVRTFFEQHLLSNNEEETEAAEPLASR